MNNEDDSEMLCKLLVLNILLVLYYLHIAIDF